MEERGDSQLTPRMNHEGGGCASKLGGAVRRGCECSCRAVVAPGKFSFLCHSSWGRRDNHPQQIVPRRLVEMKAAEGEWNHGLGPALKPISLLRTPAAWLPLAGDPKPPCPTAPSYVTPDNLSPSPVHGLQALGS